MQIRQAHLNMINAFPGGWDSMAAALGMTRMALENRVYERNGQSVPTHVSLQMQAFTGLKCFAEAISAVSGCTNIKLPEVDETVNEELMILFNKQTAIVGTYVSKFHEFTEDEELDKREERILDGVKDEMHRAVERVHQQVKRTYCKR